MIVAMRLFLLTLCAALTIAAQDQQPRPVTKDDHAYYTSPAWTAEGDYILVSRQAQQPFGAFELWMYHVGGGAGVQVTKGKLRPDAKRNEDYAHALGAVAGVSIRR